MKVLIVDDKPENLYLLESLLQSEGYEIISAKNGAEALGLALKYQPDLIISDILMPIMDGYTLCKECKKDKVLSAIPFVFYTATYTTPKDEEFARKLGADRFIIKPAEPDFFLDIITNLLEEVKEKGIPVRKIEIVPENVHLKEYNETLIRKLEDKMRQTENNERELKQYINELERTIQERKLAEQKLSESEVKFRLLWEKTDNGMRLIDQDGITVLVNSSFCRLVNLKEDELLNKPASLIYAEKERSYMQERLIENIKNSNIEPVIEKELVLHDNRRIWLEMSNSLFSIGNSKYVLSIVRDISEKKKMISELIQAKEKAEEINRIKTNFFANMSHELRTPLIAILGFSELIEEMDGVDEELRSMIIHIKKGGLRLLHTLDLILNISKLEAGKTEVKLEEVNLVPLIEKIISLSREEAKQKNITLSFDKKINEALCYLDPELTEIICTNLIKNAIKFTNQGNVNVYLDEKDSKAILRVMDTGIGIPEKYQAMIWEEFRQASEGYGRNFEGTGLGLPLARNYVTLMGGKISLNSSEGKGSEFVVEFPFLNVPTDELLLQKSTRVKNSLSSPESKEKLCILYVEDDLDARNYVTMVLKKEYNIETASSADEGLRKAKENQYDLILMDINLRKGLDGIQLTRIIRELPNYKTTPIAAVTAFAMKAEKEEFLSKEMNAYISKPFTRTELMDFVNNLAKSR